MYVYVCTCEYVTSVYTYMTVYAVGYECMHVSIYICMDRDACECTHYVHLCEPKTEREGVD